MNAIVPVTNAEVYRASTDAAGLCRDIVLKTAQNIQGRKYVKVEGWQAIAIAHGCAASADHVERVEDDGMSGFKAIGVVRRMSDGAEIARAEGFLGDDETMWSKRPVYARRAMVQTRAISRACRSAFAHVVVLIDANLSTTPAEEVPEGGFDQEPAEAQRPAPRNVTPAKAEAPPARQAKTVDWRTLDDEMDACRNLDQLEAWNKRRALDIDALPTSRYDALARKYSDLHDKFASAAEPSDEFGLQGDQVPEFA